MLRNERILRLPEVIHRTGLSRSTIYKKIKDGEFPHYISLGLRCSGWVESDINQWIAVRIKESSNGGSDDA